MASGSSGRRHAGAGRFHRSCCRPGDTRGPVNRARSTICGTCSTEARRQRGGEPLPCSATHRAPRNPARPYSTRSLLSAAMPRCGPRRPRAGVQDFPGNRPRPGLRTVRARCPGRRNRPQESGRDPRLSRRARAAPSRQLRLIGERGCSSFMGAPSRGPQCAGASPFSSYSSGQFEERQRGASRESYSNRARDSGVCLAAGGSLQEFLQDSWAAT